ncbi:SHOCT domain-containing protein [Halorubrum sp. JWXQ-INN 858]|uniref:SHOCT domain-containing protein n=1 Tax=Halorubrum sp. JWXQ-INN 858 TaxID=2690782 RepID=UPI00135A942D|nr:SHOCT domain-containing protein [Halorubrum sp. JWXQ-INN 858]MWV65007.1 SHOCT domain-containing protein [Halorubrum sp. JWXQ-INN 858]
MSEVTPLDRAKRNATGIAATTVTGVWLAALMLGYGWWLAALLFGYIVIVPVVAMVFDEDEDETEERATEPDRNAADGNAADALDRLRTRYADGELTDEEFERKLDRLLETETVADAADWTRRERARADGEVGEVDEVDDIDEERERDAA